MGGTSIYPQGNGAKGVSPVRLLRRNPSGAQQIPVIADTSRRMLNALLTSPKCKSAEDEVVGY